MSAAGTRLASPDNVPPSGRRWPRRAAYERLCIGHAYACSPTAAFVAVQLSTAPDPTPCRRRVATRGAVTPRATARFITTSRHTSIASARLAPPAAPAPLAPFADLPLDPALFRVLAEQAFTMATAIQSATLPDAIAGRDVLGRARTGSGKTLAFGLAMLTRTRRSPRPSPAAARPWSWCRPGNSPQQVADALAPYATAVGCAPPPSSAACP